MGQWPVFFLILLFIGVSNNDEISAYDDCMNEKLDVGTVLFDENHLKQNCWTVEELILLRSRKVFQNLIPKIDQVSLQTDQYIMDLLHYFDVCSENIQKFTVGKTRKLMMKALADAMGGFLNKYVMPISKASYYSGEINYENMKKIIKVFNDYKQLLHTNGDGWKKPVKIDIIKSVSPLELNIENSTIACDDLIVYNTPRKKRTLKKRSRKIRRHHHPVKRRYSSDYRDINDDFQDTVNVYLPFLDDIKDPHSIAVPFKSRTLWPLSDEKSAFILTKYYKTSVNCISSKSNFKENLQDFNKHFYEWLQLSVYPHLCDDKWYPAFAGVLKVIVFLNSSISGETPKKNSARLVAKKGIENFDPTSFGITGLIILAVMSGFVIFCIVGCTLLCYRSYTKSNQDSCRTPKSHVNVLYRNANFSCPESCSEIAPNKSLSDKIREWYRRKFTTASEVHCQPKKCEKHIITCKNHECQNSWCLHNCERSFQKRNKKLKSFSPSPTSSTCSNFVNKHYKYSSYISSETSDDVH